jgi:hypothetical protein
MERRRLSEIGGGIRIRKKPSFDSHETFITVSTDGE